PEVAAARGGGPRRVRPQRIGRPPPDWRGGRPRPRIARPARRARAVRSDAGGGGGRRRAPGVPVLRPRPVRRGHGGPPERMAPEPGRGPGGRPRAARRRGPPLERNRARPGPPRVGRLGG